MQMLYPSVLRILGSFLGLSPTQTLGSFAALTVLGLAAWRQPWKTWLAGHSDRHNIWFASIVLVYVIGSFRAPVEPGLTLHFLMTTTLTLMHGWPLAIIALAAVTGMSCIQHGDWPNWSTLFICDGAVPVMVLQVWHVLVARKLPRNYWVFFFVTAFAGSAIAFVMSGLANALMADLTGALLPGGLSDDYPIVLALMGLGEATLNGFILAGAITFHPEWVASIDEKTYAARQG
jgi:uncharacterized membrane protein